MAKADWASDWKVGSACGSIETARPFSAKAGPNCWLRLIVSTASPRRPNSPECRTGGLGHLIQEINDAVERAAGRGGRGRQAGGRGPGHPAGRAALEVYESVRNADRFGRDRVGVSRCRGEKAPCVHLAAAISLQEAVGQILSEFALDRANDSCAAIFGASNELADQLLAGAPGDVFIRPTLLN